MAHLISRIISAIAPVYDPVIDWFLGGELELRMRIIDRISVSGRVLDIGCGTGFFLSVLENETEAELYGMDLSARMLKIAVKKHPGPDYIRGNMLRMPFRDSSMDAVFSSMVMHHLSESERKISMAEIHRILRKGGVYYSLEFGRKNLGFTAKAVTGLGTMDDEDFSGFEIQEREEWEKGLVWRLARKI